MFKIDLIMYLLPLLFAGAACGLPVMLIATHEKNPRSEGLGVWLFQSFLVFVGLWALALCLMFYHIYTSNELENWETIQSVCLTVFACCLAVFFIIYLLTLLYRWRHREKRDQKVVAIVDTPSTDNPTQNVVQETVTPGSNG